MGTPLRRNIVSLSVFCKADESLVLKLVIARTTSEITCLPKYHHYDRYYYQQRTIHAAGTFIPLTYFKPHLNDLIVNVFPFVLVF